MGNFFDDYVAEGLRSQLDPDYIPDSTRLARSMAAESTRQLQAGLNRAREESEERIRRSKAAMGIGLPPIANASPRPDTRIRNIQDRDGRFIGTAMENGMGGYDAYDENNAYAGQTTSLGTFGRSGNPVLAFGQKLLGKLFG